MTTTDWFSCETDPPTRPGWYETRRPGQQPGAWIVIFLWWSKTGWTTRRPGKDACYYVFDTLHREWRGLTHPSR